MVSIAGRKYNTEMRATKYLLLPCLLCQVSCLLSLATASSKFAANPPPNFKDILLKAANVTISVDEALKKLTVEQLMNDPSFANALLEIGVLQPGILPFLSTVKLTDGTMAYDLKATARRLAKSQTSTSEDLLKIVIDSIKISDHGENIDYTALGNNPLVQKSLETSGLPKYGYISALVNVKGIVSAISVKDYLSSYLISYSTDQKAMLQNYVNYNKLIIELKPENLAKNPLLKSILGGFGVPSDLIDMVAKIDSNKLTKAVDFNKIIKAVLKYRGENATDASMLKLVKTILGNIDYKELTNQLNINQLVDLALNQSQIVQQLKKIGISSSLLKNILDGINLNDVVRVVNVGNILKFNGSIFDLPRFILNNVDLNNVLPDFNLERILNIPQIAKWLNQTKVDPKLVQTVIESVDLNKFFKAFDFKGLAKDLMANKDRDYIKVLLNNTNVDEVIMSIDVDKLFSHPAVEKIIRDQFNMDPMIAKLLLKNVKVDQLLKAIDTKAISKMLVDSVNGTILSTLEKAMGMVNFDKVIESIEISKFLESSQVKEFLKKYGIEPMFLELVAALDLDEVLKSLKIDDIIKNAIMSGNFNIQDIMQQIMKQVDYTEIIKKLDWRKLIEGASKGQVTSLPVSLECAAQLGQIALAMNSSSKSGSMDIQSMFETPAVKSKFVL